MSLADLLDWLHRHTAGMSERALGSATMRVRVMSRGSVGGTPSVGVTGVMAGCDWDHGKFIIETERLLTELSAEDVAAIRKDVAKGTSWHAYKAQKKLRLRILELETQQRETTAERDNLRKAFHEWADKTAWVQAIVQPRELGKHRADVLRDRIMALEAEVAALKQGGV